METKLCRICGKLGQNFINIFRTEGLKNKIETCLPIIVSPHSLLPDTICGGCSDNVNNFYNFIKNCLQNIIILEAQYDINESCLKAKRKYEKASNTDFAFWQHDGSTQTDDYLDLLLKENEQFQYTFSKFNCKKLVDYDVESDTESEGAMPLPLVHSDAGTSVFDHFGRNYFDDTENYLINEIAQRKKRKSEDIIECSRSKIFKMDNSSRRKNKQPKKLESRSLEPVAPSIQLPSIENGATVINQLYKDVAGAFPQLCLLCGDEKFDGPSTLASHVFECHGIDMAQQFVALNMADSITLDKRKKLPNLVKISDLRKGDSLDDNHLQSEQLCEEPPTLLPSFVCSFCPAIFTARPELFTHLRVKHPEQSSLLCGMCLHQATTLQNLQNHIEFCSQQHPSTTKYVCQICHYGDDNSKTLECHILVHDFLLEVCRKQSKMFDPADYLETNENYESGGSSPVGKSLSCSECGLDDFETFKDFSTHRRSQHSIFHCDLCNKFYGRNSHLWKHVNRLHKGNPSITCQLCYKTSASKYHLAQHFNKIHSAKSCKPKPEPLSTLSDNEFMAQKFQAFDFQSVKQSFMRQELIDQEKKTSALEIDDNSSNRVSDPEENVKQEPVSAPKEIDSSSDLYTNIITNYTPPANEGEFKCPKCSKGFHKKTLLKKHKKNCRPRLQKDLLTRCKSCARIFKDRQSLAKHLVNYHSEYACEICGQKVQSKCEIVSHIRFSHPGCHLFCTICRNILRSRNDLVEHSRDHMNSYICQFCADALPSKIKLKMHILSLHRKILSLSCGVCLKLFETQHVLRDHVRLVHKDQLAPLTSCPVCGKNYGSKWKTYDHLNKSHGRIFKACKACLDVFDTESQLQTHYDTVHANSSSNKNFVIPAVSAPPIQQNNNCETDSDGDSSEQSDTENEREDATEEEQKPDYFLDVNDSKISLLEKRLLGQKIKEEDKCNKVLASSMLPPPQLKNSTKKKEDKSIVKKDPEPELVENNHSTNPQHNSSKRTVYVNSNDPSFCEICHKNWPAKKHLWQHYIRCHKSVAATVCGICLKTNKSYSSLQEHLRANHPTLLHGQGFGSNFICRICGRYHNASSKLKLHMAIHENFDWSLLDGPQKDMKKEENGYQENSNEINYDSLIEQVECSSGSDSDTETVVEAKVQAPVVSSSDDEDDDDEEDGESESGASENSLEAQMLDNMLREKEISDNGNEHYGSSVSDDSSGASCFSVKSDDSSDANESNSSHLEGNMFRCRPEELDSAIQSIKFECVDKIDVQMDNEYKFDLQTQTLNDNEIDAAVGSIL